MFLSSINRLREKMVAVVYKHSVPPALGTTNFSLSLFSAARIPAAVPPASAVRLCLTVRSSQIFKGCASNRRHSLPEFNQQCVPVRQSLTALCCGRAAYKLTWLVVASLAHRRAPMRAAGQLLQSVELLLLPLSPCSMPFDQLSLLLNLGLLFFDGINEHDAHLRIIHTFNLAVLVFESE